MSGKARSKNKPAPAAPAQVASAGALPGALTRYADLLCIAVLLVATVVFYWPNVSGSGHLWNDFVEQNFPYRLFAAVSMRGGEFPFWNPYVFSGMPFFADIQTAVLYPLNLVLTLFASDGWLSPKLFELQVIFHVLLTGLFTFMLARDLGIGRTGSVVAALTFMFSGFLTAHIFHVNIIHTAAWFPLVILLFNRSIERVSVSWMAAAAAVLAMAVLSGYPQLLVHMYYWLGAWFLFTLIVRLRNKAAVKTEAARGALFAGLVVLSVGLSAAQLLPTAELAENSARPTMAFEESAEGSFRPYRFVTLIAPRFFGEPSGAYWGIGATDVNGGTHYYWETALYCGILPLVLAGCALAFVRTPPVLFMGIIAALSLLLAMGDSFFLYGLFYRLLPGFNRFRVPARFACTFGLSIALLAGWGLQWLLTGIRAAPARRLRTAGFVLYGALGTATLLVLVFSAGAFKDTIVDFLVTAGLGDPGQITQFVERTAYPGAVRTMWIFLLFAAASVGLVLLRIKGRIGAVPASIAAVLIVGLDLLASGYGYAANKSDPARVFAKDRLVRDLQELSSKEYFRVNTRGSKPGTDDLGGRHMLMHKNQGSVHRLFLMEGYNPLRLKRQLVNRKSRTLDILNVKFRIDVDEASGRTGIVQHPTQFPRAWVAYRYRVESRDDAILPLLYDSGFDHRNEVILEQTPPFASADSAHPASWDVTITSYSVNRIELEVDAAREGVVVLSEIHYPAWRAYVDGSEAKLLRADYALRAIPVSAGKHKVVCAYRDQSFRRGSLFSLVSLLAVVALAGWRLPSVLLRRAKGRGRASPH